jgi:hypothetical protein
MARGWIDLPFLGQRTSNGRNDRLHQSLVINPDIDMASEVSE